MARVCAQNATFVHLLKALEASDILAEYVEFDVHHSAYLDVAEVGVLTGVRDDGYRESIVGWVADGERYAIYGYAALINGEVALASHLLVQLIFEGEVG